MAETTTTRFGLNRWSADTDTVSRPEIDGAFGAIEALGMIYRQGALSARPAPGKAGTIWTNVGDPNAAINGWQYYDDGTAWTPLGLARGVVQASAAGVVPLKIDAATGQTADLLQLRSSTGVVLASFDADGDLVVPSITPSLALTQAQSHRSPDTDAGPSSLHHTVGTGANQAAAGNHGHAANVTRVPKSGGSWPARPAGATYVEWVGPSPAPTVGLVDGDTFVATA